VTVKCGWIDSMRGPYELERLCQARSVSTSGYRDRMHGSPSARA
jgi:hypothetical protein